MMKKIFLFWLFILIFSNPVLAQDVASQIVSQISSLLSQFVGVIFILIFIWILLMMGGVLPRPSGRLSIATILFLILIVLMFIIPQYIPFPEYMETPESFKYQPLPKAAIDVLKLIGLPEEWGYVPAIIYLFILPFAAIYTLVWSSLNSLKIFEGLGRVDRILALIIAFMTIPLGWFVKIVWILFSFMGIWSVVIFTATFILGALLRGAGIVVKEEAALKKLTDIRRERLKDALKEVEALQNADLNTIKNQAPSILQRFADVIPSSTGALLSEAIQQADVKQAQNYINQAVKDLKKQL
ncbi:MAG: hypothetical protein QW040_00450 [Candidatus Aenigmatarchaeota archaeon]